MPILSIRPFNAKLYGIGKKVHRFRDPEGANGLVTSPWPGRKPISLMFRLMAVMYLSFPGKGKLRKRASDLPSREASSIYAERNSHQLSRRLGTLRKADPT